MFWSFLLKKWVEGKKADDPLVNKKNTHSVIITGSVDPVASYWDKKNEHIILQKGARQFSKDFGRVMEQLANE